MTATYWSGVLARRTYIDLFAGCGGLSLGLSKAGWHGMFAVERDPMAFETLQRNLISGSRGYHFAAWPDWLDVGAHDLLQLLEDPAVVRGLKALRGTVSLVSGGPPCQGFSVGGIRDGRDKRNALVHAMLELVRHVQPAAVIVENVEGFARRFIAKPGAESTSAADVVVEVLEDMGYIAGYRTIDASRFGVPQVRKRIIIVALRQELAGPTPMAMQLSAALHEVRSPLLVKYGLPVDRVVSAGEAIADLASTERVQCPDSPKFEAGTYLRPRSAYAKLMREGIALDSLPNSHRFSKHGPRVERLYEFAHKTQPRGRLSKSFLLASGTKKDKKVLMDPDVPVSTVTTHPDEFIHYLEPRNITVREMARLQSFPDWFFFYGRYTINGPRRRYDVARCSQVGNAVPPLVGEALGEALKVLPLTLRLAHELSDTGDTSADYRLALVPAGA
jgi:DNA (cytosine-5)-methyltransferase 1